MFRYLNAGAPPPRPPRCQSETPEIPFGVFPNLRKNRRAAPSALCSTPAARCNRVKFSKALGATVSDALAQAIRHVRLVYYDALP